MAERRLRRQLNLPQVLMLGIAGTIAAEIFVLTGHIAGMAGPATVLVLFAIGVLSYTMAVNYSELGTAFPVTGGTLTWVREGFGDGLLSFLVGSLDCLSSAFYAALSAVGFAYSLLIFVPGLPIVPTALVVIVVFSVLNIMGVSNVGRIQLVLGGLLLAALAGYVVGTLVSPTGFSWATFMPDGRFFIYEGGLWGNLGPLLSSMALIFNAYIGFEIIVDDAEEVRNPNRNIPLGVLLSLGVITLIYTTVALVTLGTIPWSDLAGSETALAEAAARAMPGWGAPLIGVAGIIATLTSVNTAMLAATREALTMGRLGLWPRFLTRLGRLRTPYAATVAVGAVVGLVAAVGLVDFLSYISSSGYLFVVFWASLAMVRLRKTRPELERPFRAPLFPLTAYVAAGICVLVIAFADWQALLFLGLLLGVLTVFYLLRHRLSQVAEEVARSTHIPHDRIMVAVANPQTATGLVKLATVLAEREPGVVVNVLTVVPTNHHLPLPAREAPESFGRRQRAALSEVAEYALQHNVPFYTDVRVAPRISDAIAREVEESGNVKLVLMGWPGALPPEWLPQNPVAGVLAACHADVAVFLNRGLPSLKRILVPFGGGVHSRLALRLACQIAEQEQGMVIALRCLCDGQQQADMLDALMLMREVVEAEFGKVPPCLAMHVSVADTVQQGILDELQAQEYDLVIMGAALAASLRTDLFGSLTDAIAEQIPCSVLLVRRYEPAVVNWVRRRARAAIPAGVGWR